ncbi:hypothetical protein GF354_06785 [Candidatus Peregrinibacteria bacterium]|nr:hypothetical protein [Candidatus Peregrinibacteria bacterium]
MELRLVNILLSINPGIKAVTTEYKRPALNIEAIVMPAIKDFVLFRIKENAKIKIAFEIIIKGTIGASGSGNSPPDSATVEGTRPKKIASAGPIITVEIINIAFTIGPVNH